MTKRSNHDILQYGHLCKNIHRLECTSNSSTCAVIRGKSCNVNPIYNHIPVGGLLGAADAVYKCALSGSVWTYQADDFAFIYLQIDGIIGDKAVEVLTKFMRLK